MAETTFIIVGALSEIDDDVIVLTSGTRVRLAPSLPIPEAGTGEIITLTVRVLDDGQYVADRLQLGYTP
jgi:hypothetical protein